MPRSQRLTATAVRNLRHDGRTRSAQRHYDGDGSGLALNIRPEGTKSWVQAIVVRGKRRWFGLGPYPLVTLKRAREKALDNKRIAYEGGDPIAERDASRKTPDFRTLAERVIETQAAEHTNAKSSTQWESSLAAYAYPRIGRKRVDAITVDDVMRCVQPIWTTKRETASRVRQRIATILEAAVVYGYRSDNPAKAALLLLPKRRPPVRHHRALPWRDVPEALRAVRASGAWAGTKLAFEFLVLTAARSGEVRGATWSEMDFDTATWTVPAERMKAQVEHRVPLAPRAVDLLAEAQALVDPPMLPRLARCPLVFPSVRGKALSDSTISKLLREIGVGAVPHGFRSSFRDWASENTAASHAVMEAALAHSIPSAVERAYARSDLFDRRRELMEQWSTFVSGEPRHGRGGTCNE